MSQTLVQNNVDFCLKEILRFRILSLLKSLERFKY